MPKLAKLTTFFTAWSFSRLQDYRKCPAFAAYKHLYKMKEPGNSAMQRGSQIDQIAKDYALGRIKDSKILVPDPSKPKVKVDPLATFKAEFAKLRKMKKGAVEADPDWTFTSDWGRTKFNDWAGAWCRMKVDFTWKEILKKVTRLMVIDVKSGKQRDANSEQLKLYALGGLLVDPTADEVGTQLWYTDAGIADPKKPLIYMRSQLPELQEYWLGEVRPMLADKRFAPKPGQHCGYCFYRKANGGPCKY
jgi:hypothetical protein